MIDWDMIPQIILMYVCIVYREFFLTLNQIVPELPFILGAVLWHGSARILKASLSMRL